MWQVGCAGCYLLYLAGWTVLGDHSRSPAPTAAPAMTHHQSSPPQTHDQRGTSRCLPAVLTPMGVAVCDPSWPAASQNAACQSGCAGCACCLKRAKSAAVVSLKEVPDYCCLIVEARLSRSLHGQLCHSDADGGPVGEQQTQVWPQSKAEQLTNR